MGHLQQRTAECVAGKPGSLCRWGQPRAVFLGIAACAFIAGCASQHLEPPVAEMARAEATIENALQAGAREAAPLELQSAQRHLSRAQQASANEEYQQALWFAEKSEADAELAETKARTERAYETVAELKEGIRVLEDELERQSPLDDN